MLLESINSPADLGKLDLDELDVLAEEIRGFIVQAVSATGGHLGSNLGAVELTLALHRVFSSPRDILLWDTGHQAYVHKIVTGRREMFCEPAPDRRPVGLPVAGRVGARLGGEQPRLDDPELRPRPVRRGGPQRQHPIAGWSPSSATDP